jgi:hypothetical protein
MVKSAAAAIAFNDSAKPIGVSNQDVTIKTRAKGCYQRGDNLLVLHNHNHCQERTTDTF